LFAPEILDKLGLNMLRTNVLAFNLFNYLSWGFWVTTVLMEYYCRQSCPPPPGSTPGSWSDVLQPRLFTCFS